MKTKLFLFLSFALFSFHATGQEKEKLTETKMEGSENFEFFSPIELGEPVEGLQIIETVKNWAEGVPIIVKVDVVGVESYLVKSRYKDDETIESKIQLRIIEVVRGDSRLDSSIEKILSITVPGGDVAGKRFYTSAAPLFQSGEKGYVALRETDGRFSILKRNRAFLKSIDGAIIACINPTPFAASAASNKGYSVITTPDYQQVEEKITLQKISEADFESLIEKLEIQNN